MERHFILYPSPMVLTLFRVHQVTHEMLILPNCCVDMDTELAWVGRLTHRDSESIVVVKLLAYEV